jgi:gluconate 2-dehydrogenase gamma chain
MHSPDFYPPGTVRALMGTDALTPPTRHALTQRLAVPDQPRFFQPDEWALLRSVRERLFPQPDRAEPLEPEWELDQRLSAGKTNGWRYDGFPADGETFRRALAAINETAQQQFGTNWYALSDAQRDELLRNVQRGEVPESRWWSTPPVRFFEELLAELTEIYYAHPIAQEEIGYVGMADASGWTRIGPNEREDREPQALPHS